MLRLDTAASLRSGSARNHWIRFYILLDDLTWPWNSSSHGKPGTYDVHSATRTSTSSFSSSTISIHADASSITTANSSATSVLFLTSRLLSRLLGALIRPMICLYIRPYVSGSSKTIILRPTFGNSMSSLFAGHTDSLCARVLLEQLVFFNDLWQYSEERLSWRQGPGAATRQHVTLCIHVDKV